MTQTHATRMLTDPERVVIEATCRQLMMRYAAAMDMQDWDLFLTVFAEEVMWERPGMTPMRSHDDIRTFFTHMWRTRREANPHYIDVHLITTCSIEVANADQAHGATWCVMYSAPEHDGAGPATMPAVPELVVIYEDVFTRLPQGWRITEHKARHLFRSPAYTPPAIPERLR